MRVTEQIDALEVMATDPVHYLVVPRVWATTIMLPLLILLADAVGIGGGYLVSVVLLGANPVTYLDNTFQYMDLSDLTSGLIKAASSACWSRSVGCMKGFYTTGGAEGVGRATTRAVVVASIAILISDFFLTKLLFSDGDAPRRSAGRPTVKIRIRGLHKSLRGKRVLDGLDLEVGAGESLVIIGGSGTRQERAAQARHRPAPPRRRHGRGGRHRGRRALGNREITEFRRKFGMAFQEGALFDSMTVRRERRLPAARASGSCRQPRSSSGCGVPGHGPSRGPRRQDASAALGRDAPAGRLRPRHRPRARDPALRRADHRARPGDHGGDRRGDRGAPRAPRDHRAHHHPRHAGAFRIGDRIAMLHGGKIIALAPPEEFERLNDPRVRSSSAGLGSGPLTESRRLSAGVERHVLSRQGGNRGHAGPRAAGLVICARSRTSTRSPRRGERVDAVFDSVAGLDDKSAVRVAGVRVGRVDGIRLQGKQAAGDLAPGAAGRAHRGATARDRQHGPARRQVRRARAGAARGERRSPKERSCAG